MSKHPLILLILILISTAGYTQVDINKRHLIGVSINNLNKFFVPYAKASNSAWGYETRSIGYSVNHKWSFQNKMKLRTGIHFNDSRVDLFKFNTGNSSYARVKSFAISSGVEHSVIARPKNRLYLNAGLELMHFNESILYHTYGSNYTQFASGGGPILVLGSNITPRLSLSTEFTLMFMYYKEKFEVTSGAYYQNRFQYYNYRFLSLHLNYHFNLRKQNAGNR